VRRPLRETKLSVCAPTHAQAIMRAAGPGPEVCSCQPDVSGRLSGRLEEAASQIRCKLPRRAGRVQSLGLANPELNEADGGELMRCVAES
jgi:hypothetical protein